MNAMADFNQGHFYFDPNDPIYTDHFPGHPVVPGSLIVHAFITAASQSSPASVPRGIRNFRFKRFISPGRYGYRMQRERDGSLACTLLADHAVVVTGSIIEL
jgi:3-hydroxyacyl-[acyl-carrier-protein] dehydratase